MREINLTRGYVAIVDDEDYGRLSKFNWYPCVDSRKDGTIRNVYAQALIPGFAKWPTVKMHRFILGTNDPKVFTDHIDHNGLHNWRSNIRTCDHKQNVRNSRGFSCSTSAYKGVAWIEKRGKWYASITYDKKRICMGYFPTANEAAIAYNIKATELFGQFAFLNEIRSS